MVHKHAYPNTLTRSPNSRGLDSCNSPLQLHAIDASEQGAQLGLPATSHLPRQGDCPGSAHQSAQRRLHELLMPRSNIPV